MSNAQPISSLNLSFLSFALSSWLDGSTQIRRSLALLPLEHSGSDVLTADVRAATQASTSSAASTSMRERLFRYAHMILRKPNEELSETGKAVVGLLDVSVRTSVRLQDLNLRHWVDVDPGTQINWYWPITSFPSQSS